MVNISKPMLLAFLLMVLIITSQFEWKTQLVSDVEVSPSVSDKQQRIAKREETVKEKIILSQEKKIQKLNEVIRSLQEKLTKCQSNNETMNNIYGEKFIELEQQQIQED